MKQKLLSPLNILTTLKAVVSNIISGVAVVLFWLLAMFLVGKGFFVLGIILAVLSILFYLLFWGWISNKLWSWK